MDGFIEGFIAAGGWVDQTALTIQSVEDQGNGAIAARDIQPATPLFHIPSRLILSSYNSDLRQLLDAQSWRRLGTGWSPLILTLMWESAKPSSQWAFYFDHMPTDFDTPMFWNKDQLYELKGTDIEKRIGRIEAEEEYDQRVLPVLQRNPHLFPPNSPHYSRESFHLHGSRILSRSFMVVKTKLVLEHRASAPTSSPDGTLEARDDSNGDSVSRRNCQASGRIENSDEDESDNDDDDDDDESDEEPAMIPLADMLNAAYERDNARLFDDDDETLHGKPVSSCQGASGFTMVSTRCIKAGEQIFNTYGSPPNSELLRKYGHVDVFPLDTAALSGITDRPLGSWHFGNPGDAVALSGDLVVSAVREVHPKSIAQISERVDRWLDEGQDDTFDLQLSPAVDPDLISFVRLLLYEDDWERLRLKGKPPKPLMNAEVASVIMTAVTARLAQYTIPDMTEDSLLMKGSFEDPRVRLASIVRLGEKRILHAVLHQLRAGLPSDLSTKPGSKRYRETEPTIGRKQARS